MSATAIFRRIFYSIIHRLSYAIGADIQDADFRFSWRAFNYLGPLLIYMFGQVYTCLVMDYEKVLKAMATVCTALQGIYTFYLLIYEARTFRQQTTYLHSIYQQCELHPAESAICLRWSQRFLLLCKAFGLTVCGTIVAFYLSPAIVYAFDGSLVPMMPTYLPRLDTDTASGYTAMFLLHMVIIAVGCIQLYVTAMTIFLLILHVCLMAELVIRKLDVLDDDLRTTVAADSRPLGSWARRQHLVNTIRMHTEMCRYIDGLSTLTYVLFILEVMLDGLSMCWCMFTLFQFTWLPLYLLYAMYLFKLLTSCVLGTLVEVYSIRILDRLLLLKWYRLSQPEQRIYAFIVHRSQNATVLLAGTKTLNMELFVSVMKGTYTIAMFMLEMT